MRGEKKILHLSRNEGLIDLKDLEDLKATKTTTFHKLDVAGWLLLKLRKRARTAMGRHSTNKWASANQ